MIKTWMFLVMLVVGANVAEATTVDVVMETNYGDIRITLQPDLAPVTVANFLDYVEDDFYDGLIFHRVVPAFVIQGGGYDHSYLARLTSDPIVNESDNSLSNVRGSIAMARTSVLDSATSQFFINTVDNTFLDAFPDTNDGYAVFGHLTMGIEVVDAIDQVPTMTIGNAANVPVEPVLIKSVYVVPEPATYSLLLLGGIVLALTARISRMR